MKVFVYDDLDCYPIPSFLIEVSPYDLYKNWSAYQLMIKADFELLFNKIQCYHGTKADPISIQRDGLKILTLDKLEKMDKDDSTPAQHDLEVVSKHRHDDPYVHAQLHNFDCTVLTASHI